MKYILILTLFVLTACNTPTTPPPPEIIIIEVTREIYITSTPKPTTTPIIIPIKTLVPTQTLIKAEVCSKIGNGITIRKRPNTNSDIIGRIAPGECTQTTKFTLENKWLYLENELGWACAKYFTTPSRSLTPQGISTSPCPDIDYTKVAQKRRKKTTNAQGETIYVIVVEWVLPDIGRGPRTVCNDGTDLGDIARSGACGTHGGVDNDKSTGR